MHTTEKRWGLGTRVTVAVPAGCTARNRPDDPPLMLKRELALRRHEAHGGVDR